MVIILSGTIFSTNTYAQDEGEEYYSIDDEYAQNYDEEYFKDNAITIKTINNMIEENNKRLSLHDLQKIKIWIVHLY